MNKIIETREYNKFKSYNLNRPVNQHLVELLKVSISKNNMLRFFPILVNHNMEVIDGQHRLAACRDLNEPVCYVINDEITDADMIEINNNKAIWTYQNYLDYYCKKGYPEYLKLNRLINKYKLKLEVLLQFKSSGGTMSLNSDLRRSFSEGRIVFLPEDVICKMIDLFLEFQGMIKSMLIYQNKKFIESKAFFRALNSVLNDPEIALDEFRYKLMLGMNKVRPCASVSLYREMFQDIYNYKRKNPINFTE
jgi:hypothetical protein